jgi:ELWxxDGT repeat protein
LAEGYPLHPTACNGRLFFGGRDATGMAAWVTDGTAAGTVQLAAASLDDNPGTALCVNGVFYFSARTSTAGRELWRSDGTAAGTALVLDIAPGSADSSPGQLTEFLGQLYFAAAGRLWRSDGTPAGTVQVSANASAPTWMTAHGASLYFSSEGPFGREPWKSDGTEAGTAMIKDINASGSSFPYKFTVSNGIVYFGAEQFAGSQQLWRTDGTEAGTLMVKQISPGSVAGFGDSIADVNGTLFFSAIDAAYGRELWKSDGTAAGTVLVKDLNAGTNGSEPTSFLRLGSALLFSAGVTGIGTELWRSDGTQAGTVLVKDLCAGQCTGGPVFRP